MGRAILGVEFADPVLLAVVVHSATAFSTIIVYRKDIWHILIGLIGKDHEQRIFAGKIIISMLPAAAIGLIFEEQIDLVFGKSIWLIGICLVFTGGLLLLADKANNTTKKVGFLASIWIGLAQAIAILPGISRSGATISTAVLLKIDRTEAARFSFLMVLPLILGKMTKDILSGDLAANADMAVPLTVAFFAALLTGIFACRAMIYLVRKSQLKWFAFYCFLVGLTAFSSIWWL